MAVRRSTAPRVRMEGIRRTAAIRVTRRRRTVEVRAVSTAPRRPMDKDRVIDLCLSRSMRSLRGLDNVSLVRTKILILSWMQRWRWGRTSNGLLRHRNVRDKEKRVIFDPFRVSYSCSCSVHVLFVSKNAYATKRLLFDYHWLPRHVGINMELR